MTANTQDKTIPEIQELVAKHKDQMDEKQFSIFLDRARLAYEQFKAAVFTRDEQNRISSLLSNVRLIDYLWTTLLDDLSQVAEEVNTPEQKQQFLDDIKSVRKNFMEFIPKFRLQSEGLKQNFPEMFPSFNWHGNYVKFYSSEELGHIAETLCHELIKTGSKSIKFEVYLPNPTRQEQEQEKNAPRERMLPYAKKMFEAAAKAGFPPDEVELTLDGKKIDPKHEDFKAEYASWKKMSFNAIKSKIENTTGVKLTSIEVEPERSSYKP